MKVNTRRVYQALATEIRIQGINNAPKENMNNDRPLRVAIQEAIDHFTYKFPDSRLLAVDSQEKIMARFLFTKDISKELSTNFLKLVVHLGQGVAGDEKLLHFTGA